MVDPDDVEVLFRLAGIIAGRGDLSAAVDLLDAIPTGHAEAGIPALGQSADWCTKLERYGDAERRYRKILELFPQAAEAHRKLAHLYNRQGRRHEAAAHVIELCRQGNVRQDELHSLIHLSNAMYDDPSSQTATPDDDSYWPIGPSADARKLFTEERFKDALIRLHDSVAAGEQPASIVALYGRIAAEAQDDQRFHWWLTQVDESTQEFSEYWAALGTFLLSKNRHGEAARALLEAVDRDSTDFRSIGRLRSTMEVLAKTENAALWEKRSAKLRRSFDANNRIAKATTPDNQSVEDLAGILDSLDRRLEAVLWRSVAGYNQQLSPNSMQKLREQLRQIVQADRGFPNRASRLCNIALGEFPLPSIKSSPEPDVRYATTGNAENAIPHPARFENVASELGLAHAYHVASTKLDYGFSIYQSIGGAVAVLDYDLDGHADLYFAQGGADAPSFVGQQSNLMYRSLQDKLLDVTASAGVVDLNYSLGVTAGDWNQDGFADLVVGNIGANWLFVNNGDGTFTRALMDDADDKAMLTTSLAMGDLTGDALPDVFTLNYLHDPEIAKRPQINEHGEVITSLVPRDFHPGLDRIIINDGRGKALFHDISDAESTSRTGLGVVLGDFDHVPGNEVFVGNDGYANQLWKHSDDGRWADVAMLDGCAYGASGAKTASMGIAAGDFDRNGWLDLHVTNFQNESVSFYLNDGGSYQDRSIQFGLSAPSKSVLGFGTQAIDYDNDGRVDLVVTNGHIEKTSDAQAAFKQPIQLFSNLGGRFELASVSDDSGYWKSNHLGRALARLDFNRDGKMDFVVTHLGETSALLLNRTPTKHHWLQLVLRGVSSERDAIGARVQLSVSGRQLTEWVTSGDGFLCRNEPVLSFGLGNADRIDEVLITWPSGITQEIHGVRADRRLLVIENQPDPFEW